MTSKQGGERGRGEPSGVRFTKSFVKLPAEGKGGEGATVQNRGENAPRGYCCRSFFAPG